MTNPNVDASAGEYGWEAGLIRKPFAGGMWNIGIYCGSRCIESDSYPARDDPTLSTRGCRQSEFYPGSTTAAGSSATVGQWLSYQIPNNPTIYCTKVDGTLNIMGKSRGVLRRNLCGGNSYQYESDVPGTRATLSNSAPGCIHWEPTTRGCNERVLSWD